MELKKPRELFRLEKGDLVSKRNLFDLIVQSKVMESPYWGGSKMVIGNTPQQGINWIGSPPDHEAVIIKTNLGAYVEGYQDTDKSFYRYALKAKNGKVEIAEKANKCLLNQPVFHYPILLFIEKGKNWMFEGFFYVSNKNSDHVILRRGKISICSENPAERSCSQ